jgi:hypothetical protein
MSLFEDPEIYRTVLESVQNGIYLVDRTEKIRFWNERAEKSPDTFGRMSSGILAEISSPSKNRRARTEYANLAAHSLPCCVMAGQ